MADRILGAYFERMKITINNDTIFDAGSVFNLNLTGTENSSRVHGFSDYHTMSGAIHGNSEYDLVFSRYLSYATGRNSGDIDWKGIDYDLDQVNISLIYPRKNFVARGQSVYAGSNKYVLCTGCFLATHDPINISGVGQAATETVHLFVTDWQILSLDGSI